MQFQVIFLELKNLSFYSRCTPLKTPLNTGHKKLNLKMKK